MIPGSGFACSTSPSSSRRHPRGRVEHLAQHRQLRLGRTRRQHDRVAASATASSSSRAPGSSRSCGMCSERRAAAPRAGAGSPCDRPVDPPRVDGLAGGSERSPPCVDVRVVRVGEGAVDVKRRRSREHQASAQPAPTTTGSTQGRAIRPRSTNRRAGSTPGRHRGPRPNIRTRHTRRSFARPARRDEQGPDRDVRHEVGVAR
ncbi:hypothetical protein Pfo_031582, partial [Paulownia fortunei]